MNTVAGLLRRWIALTVVLFLAFPVAAALSGLSRAAPPVPPAASAPVAADALPAAATLFLFCALVAAVFTWMVLRSRLRGWRLAAAVAFAYFGLGTLLPQVESVVFLSGRLPPGFVGRLFVMGAIVACLFALGSVAILGRLEAPRAPEAIAGPAEARRFEWAWKVAVLAVAYVAVYFLAGYFIAFRNPEVLAYYADTDPGSFSAQIAKVWASAPWLFAFQALRGALWVAFVVPVIRSFQGRPLELPFLIGCLYGVWSVMLLLPNPYMPPSVRMTHLVETLPSNFVFGWLVGVLLGPGGTRGAVTQETS